MSYDTFDTSKPATADTGTQFIDNTRLNLLAVRDAAIAGILPGWAATVTTPGAEPDVITYALGTERIRLTYTWSSGRPATIKYEYSPDSGSNYYAMFSTNGLQTLTYDGSGYFSSDAWS